MMPPRSIVWEMFCPHYFNHWSQCRLFIVIMCIMKSWCLPVDIGKGWLMDHRFMRLSRGEKSGQPRAGLRQSPFVTHLWQIVAQLVKNLPAMRKTGVWSLGCKIPWRSERLPTPVFCPGDFHGLYRVHRVTKSSTRLSDFHFHVTWSLDSDSPAFSEESSRHTGRFIHLQLWSVSPGASSAWYCHVKRAKPVCLSRAALERLHYVQTMMSSLRVSLAQALTLWCHHWSPWAVNLCHFLH